MFAHHGSCTCSCWFLKPMGRFRSFLVLPLTGCPWCPTRPYPWPTRLRGSRWLHRCLARAMGSSPFCWKHNQMQSRAFGSLVLQKAFANMWLFSFLYIIYIYISIYIFLYIIYIYIFYIFYIFHIFYIFYILYIYFILFYVCFINFNMCFFIALCRRQFARRDQVNLKGFTLGN